MAALAILCPNAWLNESDHLQVGLSDHLDLARQDYSVCFLPNDHCALPQGRLAAADRALARTNHQDEARGLVGCLSSRGLLWAAHCGGALCLCASPRGVSGLSWAQESVGVLVAANPPPNFARRELQKILTREGPMAPRIQESLQFGPFGAAF